MSGLGTKTCNEITDAISKKESSQQDLLNWTQGYFSGANVAYGLRSKRGDVTTGSTVLFNRLMSLVKTKCDDHPEYLLSKAVDEVCFELRQAEQ